MVSKFNWLLGFVWVYFMMKSFFWIKKKFFSLFYLLSGLHQNKSSSENFNKMKGVYKIMFILFLIMMGMNLWGLIPYIFAKTSQILFVLVLSFSVWMSLILSSFKKSMLKFMYIFFPSSPGFILPFLKVMEIVSFFIRPLTLTLRLSMNITTGHIFVSLLSKIMLFLTNSYWKDFFLYFILWIFVMSVSCGMFFFESCMGMIQSLVFSLLLTSYFEDHTH